MKKQFVVILAAILMLSGCNALQYPAYVLFGGSKVKVKAEYEGLTGQSTALMLISRPGIDFEFPLAKIELALAANSLLAAKIEGCTLVDQQKVDDIQQTNLDWMSMPFSQLGDKLQANRIVYVDLIQFTMNETDGSGLLRGRLVAAVSVYEIDGKSPDGPVYETEIAVTLPKYGPTFMNNGTLEKFYRMVIDKFALELARKFYDHKVKADE